MQTTPQPTIPIAAPLLSDEDKRRVLAVLESGHLVAGRWVREFERAFSVYLGAGHGAATSSGTTALEVILEVAGQTVTAPEDVYSALSSARGAGKRLVLMRIKSSSKTRFLAVPVG